LLLVAVAEAVMVIVLVHIVTPQVAVVAGLAIKTVLQ
jgi:hypothetical protein